MRARHMYYNLYILIILAGLLPVLAGCSRKQADAYAPPPPPSVTVSLPVQKEITNFAEFSGTTEAVESVSIRARVEGFLEAVHFSPGTMIKKDDLLYSIDPKPYQARLDEMTAALEIRNAELQLAQATSLRRTRAFKDRAVSEVAVIEAKAQLAAAKASIVAATAAVQTAQLNLSYTQIKSPISGRIGRSLIDVGNLVGAGERTLLTTIVKDDPIYAYFTMSERDLLHYQGKFDLKSPPTDGEVSVFLGLSGQTEHPFSGHIDYMDNRVDPNTGTIRIRGVFANSDHNLMPGLFARIKIPLGKAKNELLVPDIAIGRDQQGHYLLTADKENKVEYKPVTTGVLVDGMRVITQGIGKDDSVIVNGIQKARPGMPVTPAKKTPSDKTESESTNEPVNEPTDEPVNESTDEPVNEPTDEPVNEPTNEPADKASDKADDESDGKIDIDDSGAPA
ncbi:efflux RND transporter periplasmic adaptor subunit [Desulfobacterales bacterium HSG16]|nr:efflux RND transporter periplasmic adaptor subunit [Desulfobacterales bacterium HSG16]